MNYWRDHIHYFREAIWRDVCFDSEGNQIIDIDLEDFLVMSFVDCMPHRSTTPGAGPINEEGDRREHAYLIQREFYTRYGKIHGNKTLGLLLPNGMIGHTWVHSVAQNDLGMINLSGLEEYLRDIFKPYRVGEAQLLPAIYGDAIYQPSEVILVGRSDSLYFQRMNSAREKIEHEFGLCAILWKK